MSLVAIGMRLYDLIVKRLLKPNWPSSCLEPYSIPGIDLM